MSIFTDVLRAIASPITAVVSSVGNLVSTNTANQNNKEIMRESAKINQQNWEKQFAMQNQRQDFLNNNAYSTLVNSAQNAGLSPLSALGNSQFSNAVSSGGSSTSSPASARSADFSLLANLGLDYVRAQNINADTDVKKAERDLVLQQINESKSKQYNLDANTKFTLESLAPTLDKLNSETLYNKALEDNLGKQYALNYQHMLNESNLTTARIDDLLNQIQNRNIVTDIQLQKLPYETQVMCAQAYELNKRGLLNDSESKLVIEQISKIPYDIAESCARAGLSNAETQKVIVSTIGARSDNQWKAALASLGNLANDIIKDNEDIVKLGIAFAGLEKSGAMKLATPILKKFGKSAAKASTKGVVKAAEKVKRERALRNVTQKAEPLKNSLDTPPVPMN
ncbi:hypothetical protein [Capybara microvirus Cap3_SP_315]|nr:hypothetical protein [Capybara microvirus Cap3_SP_315]